MAKTRLSAANYVVHGYGQVEPNHLSAQRTGQIYGQLPVADGINVLENGQFAKYDYANKAVNFSGPGEWLLTFNEIKLYDVREAADDYAMLSENFGIYSYGNSGVSVSDDLIYNSLGTAGVGDMFPRLFKTNVGDIFTTNLLNVTVDKDSAIVDPVVGQFAVPGSTGILQNYTTAESVNTLITTLPAAGMAWEIVLVWTLPDNQRAVKLVRVQ